MRALLAVFRKEFLESLRDRRTLFSALLFGPLFAPVLFGALLQFSFERNRNEFDRPVQLAVAHAERAPNLLAYLGGYRVAVERVSYDDDAARHAVRTGKHKVVLLIPEDFGTRLRAGDPAPVLLYADDAELANDRSVERLRAIIGQYGQVIGRLRLLVRGVDPLVLAPLPVQDIDVSTPATRSVLALGALSYLIIITMLMGGLPLAIDATAGERERGSLEPLLTTPVPREYLIYGKILAASAYMLISLVGTATAFALVLRVVGLERWGMSANLGPLAVAALIGCSAPLILLGASLMTIIAAFTRSYREAQTYLGIVLLVPTLPLIFASMTGLKPTLALMAVPSLSQHFLIMSLLRDESLPVSYLAVSLAASLGFGVLLARIAGRLYSREALLG